MLADKEIQLYREICHFDPVLYQLNPTHIYALSIYKISFNIIIHLGLQNDLLILGKKKVSVLN
jgi:hypothetical protein